MYSSTLSLTLALDEGGWSTPRPGCFTPGKETRYPLYRRQAGLNGCGKSCPPPHRDSIPGPTVLSIWGLYYTFKLQMYGMYHDGESIFYPWSRKINTSLKRRAIILPVLSTEGFGRMNLLMEWKLEMQVYCFTTFIQAIACTNNCTKSEQ
jgi:hypothetical protein